MKLLNNQPIKTVYADFIMHNGPYSHFITLTFPHLQTEHACTQQVSYLLHLLNRKIYGRNQTDKFLSGFCFIENHRSSANNPFHCHIIIKQDDCLNVKSKPTLTEHFWHLIPKVKIIRNYQVTGDAAFRPNCCDIKTVYDQTNLISYLTKSLEFKPNENFLRPIDKNGI